MNRGAVNGRQVIPESWIAECRRAQPRPFHPTSFGADLPGARYHNQWWRLDRRIYAMGIHGQMIAIDEDADMVVVFVGSAPEPNSTPQRLEQLRIVAALSAALS